MKGSIAGPRREIICRVGNGSTLVRRQLGHKLRRLRVDAGKTHADVEAARIASATKMWRIETGKTPVRPGDVWALARLYDAPTEVADQLATLAATTFDPSWVQEYSDAVPDWLSLYAGLEAAASVVNTWHAELIYGLCQTTDYARAVIRADRSLSEEVVEQRLAFRLERQRASSCRVVSLLGAGALALEVGSKKIMAAQVAHLRGLHASGQADIRVVPWSAGAHRSMKGPFAMLDYDTGDDPSFVFIETLVGSRYVEQPTQVSLYRSVLTELREQSIAIEDYSP